MAEEHGTVDLSTVLRGRDVICLSHDWSGDPLSRTHLMRQLTRENRVLWVNSIGYRTPSLSRKDMGRAWSKVKAATRKDRLREVEPNLHVLNPLAIPLYQNPLVRGWNRRWLSWQIRKAMKTLGFRNPINWTANPMAAVVAGTLGESLLIYHCVDEYSAFSDVPSKTLAELEGVLLQKADMVITTAAPLYESKRGRNPRTVLVRHGVDVELFNQALNPDLPVADALVNLPKPILGFFGLLADWVDVELMAAAARKYPHGTLVLLGKSTTNMQAFDGLPNVVIPGRVPYTELPRWCKGFDVALMPFRLNELTRNANPLKVREYLAAGLPVISTALPEVEAVGNCAIAHNEAEFLALIEDALTQPPGPGPRQERAKLMERESWSARLDEIRGHLVRLGLDHPANANAKNPA